MTTLRLIDLFSGIGGFSYAAEHLVGGYSTVQFVEREPYCHRILHKYWPTTPIHDDICTFNPKLGSADVVCGGFSCQDISLAGKQAGIKEGTRSGLFYELMRVVRMVQPRYVILENVSAIISNGLDTVLGELAAAGFDAEWACIPASAVGACHQRDRWWCVAYSNDAGVEAPRAKLTPTGAEQCGGLAAGSTPDPMRNRLQGSHQLECSWPQWRAAPSRLDPDWRRYVSQPVLRRGDDGLSSRVDRLRALGNAVVPQVAAIPLMRVLELEDARH